MSDNSENAEARDEAEAVRSNRREESSSGQESHEGSRVGIILRTLRGVQDLLPESNRPCTTSNGPNLEEQEGELADNSEQIEAIPQASTLSAEYHDAQTHSDDSESECRCSDIARNENKCNNVSLDDMPLHVIHKVLGHLPPWDTARACEVNSTFFKLGNSLIRMRFNRLLDALKNELVVLREELAECDLSQQGIVRRVFLYRSYSTCEFLKSEMFSTRAVGRLLLISKDRAFNFGRLLQEYNMLYCRAVERTLPPWQVNDWLTLSIWKLARGFMAEKGLHRRDPRSPLGTRLLDLADALIDRQLSQKHIFTMDSFGNVAVTCDKTYFMHPQYVARPPFFPDRDPPAETILTNPNPEQVKAIMEFILNFVKVNNRILLREEQYNRELEYTNRLGNEGSTRLRWLIKEPRNYAPPPGPPFELSGGGSDALSISVSSATIDYPTTPPRNVKRRYGWG